MKHIADTRMEWQMKIERYLAALEESFDGEAFSLPPNRKVP